MVMTLYRLPPIADSHKGRPYKLRNFRGGIYVPTRLYQFTILIRLLISDTCNPQLINTSPPHAETKNPTHEPWIGFAALFNLLIGAAVRSLILREHIRCEGCELVFYAVGGEDCHIRAEVHYPCQEHGAHEHFYAHVKVRVGDI